VFEGVWLDDVGLDPSLVSVEVGAESWGLLDSAALVDVLGEEESVSPGLVNVLGEGEYVVDVLGEEDSVSTGLVCESVGIALKLVDVEDVDDEVVSVGDPVWETEWELSCEIFVPVADLDVLLLEIDETSLPPLPCGGVDVSWGLVEVVCLLVLSDFEVECVSVEWWDVVEWVVVWVVVV
jgi:hypothetical protein